MPYIANPLEGLPIRNSFIIDQTSLGAAPATNDTLIIYDLSTTSIKQLTIANLTAGVLVAPAMTGVPTAPTANAGTNTTQVATTAFVLSAVATENEISEMNDVTLSSIGSGEVLKWNGSAWINNNLAELGVLPVADPTFTGTLTVGSAAISEADLEQIDDLTAGTAVASKALVVDSNKDIGTIRNLTIDGVFTDGNYTFDTSGNVAGLGTVASGTHTIGSLVVAAASITDTSGALSFGNENLSTTGTLAAGTTTIGTLTVAAASITDSSGTISFGNENLTTTGVVTAGGITLGSAVLIEAELEMLDGITAGTAVASKAVVLDSNKDIGTIRNLTIDGTFSDGNYTFDTSGNVSGLGTIGSGAITSSGIVTGTGFTAGSAVLAEAELELLDGLTAGTAIATKVVTTDGNIDTTGQRNLTISGELDAATGDFSGVVDVAGAFTTSTIVASGIVKTDDTTNATSITDGSLQTDGGLSVTLDAIIGDDLTLISDAAVLNFGVNSDVSLTHVHDTGLLLNSSRKIQFGDAGTFIHQSGDGVLTIESDTTVDINGAVALNGAITGATDITLSGALSAGSYVGLPASNSTTSGIAELAITSEINTGTDSTRIMPIDQYVASHRNIRYILYRIVASESDVEAATAVGGDFEFPFTGTITAVGTYSDTAGSSSEQIVDIHLNPGPSFNSEATIMSSAKLDTDSGEKSTRTAGNQFSLTTTAITAGDILTFDVDQIHSTAAKGLTVRLEVRVT